MRSEILMRVNRVTIAAVVLAAFVAGPVRAQAPPSPAPLPDPNSAVATVNGETITLAQLDAVLKQHPIIAPLNAAQLRQLRAECASEMVDDLLLRQFLRKYGAKIEPAEVEKHFKALAESLAKQNKTITDFFREIGQTETQARETWTAMMQLSRYVKEHITEEQLRQYFAANKDHFDRVEVKASHIVLRVSKKAPDADREAARQKLRSLRAEIAAGKFTFADAARKYSLCPSAPQGGDLGFITRKGMLADEVFCAAAFKLKVGEISDVVETDSGLHLISITDRKPGTPSAFEKCVEDVRDAFTDDFRTEVTAKLRKQAQVQITLP